MFDGVKETLIQFIQDAQVIIVPLMALSFLAAGVVFMFGDMGRRWAKGTVIWCLVGGCLALSALAFARSAEGSLKFGSIANQLPQTIEIIQNNTEKTSI